MQLGYAAILKAGQQVIMSDLIPVRDPDAGFLQLEVYARLKFT